MSTTPPQVRPTHLRRPAIVYVRQSSPEQVKQHTGSADVQRELATMLNGWGWAEDSISIRDEDLGKSGSVPDSRLGFANLINEMRAGAWGIVAVVDSSRVARNDLEEATFATVARQYDVLLAIGSSVVDFRDPNSAFIGRILGLNATRENRVRVQMSQQAKRKKAEQGKTVTVWPVGYVKGTSGTWVKDPDPRVRAAIELVFEKFHDLRSAGAVWRYFRKHGIKLPARFSGEDLE